MDELSDVSCSAKRRRRQQRPSGGLPVGGVGVGTIAQRPEDLDNASWLEDLDNVFRLEDLDEASGSDVATGS